MDIPMKTLEEIPFPTVTKDLIMSLDQLYPERCPDPEDKLSRVWYKSGQRSVVNFLIEQRKRQNETIR